MKHSHKLAAEFGMCKTFYINDHITKCMLLVSEKIINAHYFKQYSSLTETGKKYGLDSVNFSLCELQCTATILGVVEWCGGTLQWTIRPTNLDNRRTRVCCACGTCGWVLFGHFFSHHFTLFCLTL